MTILGVGAHPDDLDFSAAGSFAKWIDEGHDCYYLILTDGRKGSSDETMTEEDLIKLRRKEQIEAGEILGLKGVFFLDNYDTMLTADYSLKKEIVRYIRKLKPDAVVTMDPAFIYSSQTGYINHTDHRACGLATIDAVFPLARDRLTFSELEKEGLSVHKVKTVYLITYESPNEIIDISNTYKRKMEAMQAHKSQLNERVLEFITSRAKALGEKGGFNYGEGFIKLVMRL